VVAGLLPRGAVVAGAGVLAAGIAVSRVGPRVLALGLGLLVGAAEEGQDQCEQKRQLSKGHESSVRPDGIQITR
jgi:hypothetical protein